MLRVELEDTSNKTLMRVKGRIAGPLAADTTAIVLRGRSPSRLIVDVSKVTFVDPGGENVLLWLGRIGAQFLANSYYSLHVCERLHLPILKWIGPEPEAA